MAQEDSYWILLLKSCYFTKPYKLVGSLSQTLFLYFGFLSKLVYLLFSLLIC